MTMSREIQTPGATPAPPAPTKPTPPPAKPSEELGDEELTAEQQMIAELKAQNAALQAQVNRKPAKAHAPTSNVEIVSAKSVNAKKIKRAVLTDEGYICPAPPLEDKK